MLRTQFINDPRVSKAADEVISNIKLLIIAGYHNEAIGVSEKLLSAGPWRVNPNTAQIDELQRLHQMLCWLCDKDCPEIAGEPAQGIRELKDKAEESWNAEMDHLLMSDRIQNEPAGASWNDAFFIELDEMDKSNGTFREYGLFINDVDWILKQRLREKTHRLVPNLIPDFIADLMPSYRTDNDILLSPHTSEYKSHWLTDKLDSCIETMAKNSKYSDLGYMEIRIFLLQLIIDVIDNNEASEIKQIKRLLEDDDKHELLELVYWPEFRDQIESGVYRQVTGLDDSLVAKYLQAVSSRKAVTKTRAIETNFPSTAVDLSTFHDIAQNTLLERLEFIDLPVPLSDLKVLATKVDHKSALSIWKEARSLLKDTGRWPVLFIGWGGIDNDWRASLKEEDLFDREHFQGEYYEGDRTGLSVDELITGAGNIDLRGVYHELATSNYEDIAEYLSYQADEDTDVITSDILSKIDCSTAGAFADASKQLSTQIIESQGLPDPFPITWFDLTKTDQIFLLLMPTDRGWEIPAYVQWYGSESCGTEITVAQLKEWNEKYGAELVCHYGTMLQLTVNRRPDSIDEALDLAYQQDSLAQCTLSGSTMAEYAVSLMHSDIWFLHERP